MPVMLLLFLIVLMQGSTYLTPFGCSTFMSIASASSRTDNFVAILDEF
jgi:uncharacterized membrane protein